MKVLRNICPLLFLLLSLACAAYTTVQIGEYQRNLPGGVLAVLDKEEGAEQANFYHSDVVPAMEALRAPVDKLEMIVDKEAWPMPSYGDLIFEV